MRIKEIQIDNFKRFTNLTIRDIPSTAKLVLLVGPNGCGKTSLFEAFNHWYKYKGHNSVGDEKYYIKDKHTIDINQPWYVDNVNIYFHEGDNFTQEALKGCFYFRTAYRNDPDFTIQNLSNQQDPTKTIQFDTLMNTDQTVSGNYQRLISRTLSGVYDNSNDKKTISDYREELIGKVKISINNVFEDLHLSSIGDPLMNGSFYFKKGIIEDYHYRNLSAGEKSAFDILLDMIIKIDYFKNTIFCIDEPEAHMHTKLQAKLLGEMFHLIPDNNQLWISTHSIGMLKKAREIEASNPGSVIFLDFTNIDFDSEATISPSTISKTIWTKFLELALDDFALLIAPKIIVYCEGNPNGNKNKNFDSQVYEKIFSLKYPEVIFTSLGSCDEIENPNNQVVSVIEDLLKSTIKIKVVDRDNRSEEEVEELKLRGVKVLSKRHLESYLLDDEIIKKLCDINNAPEKIQECLDAKKVALNKSNDRGNDIDDIKSASGHIYISLKKILSLQKCGNTNISFLRDTIAPLVTENTAIYKLLEKDIFEPSVCKII